METYLVSSSATVSKYLISPPNYTRHHDLIFIYSAIISPCLLLLTKISDLFHESLLKCISSLHAN